MTYRISNLGAALSRYRSPAPSHFAFPIVGGREPLWQVFTAQGRFVRYATSRAMVEARYPPLVWRRWMVEWSSPVSEFRNHDVAERLDTAEQRTGRRPRR